VSDKTTNKTPYTATGCQRSIGVSMLAASDKIKINNWKHYSQKIQITP